MVRNLKEFERKFAEKVDKVEKLWYNRMGVEPVGWLVGWQVIKTIIKVLKLCP